MSNERFPPRFADLLSLACALLMTTEAADAKPNVNKRAYPLGNPVITHRYTADAAPHVMPDGRVWMVTSVDREDGGGYAKMPCYHAFSSANLRDWVDHGEVFHVDAVRPQGEPTEDQWALWAPDFIYRNGKYYLYYPVWVLHPPQEGETKRETTSWIGVAVAETPTGPYQVLNPKIEGASGIDPAVFCDDDGVAYLYWGSQRVARLADNMAELAERPRRMEVGTDRFMEAAWMTKHQGRYIISYHTKYLHGPKITAENRLDPNRPKSELAWSVGDSPYGPFEYGGVLNHELGVNVDPDNHFPDHPHDFVPWALTQSNHGGIVEYHGSSYLFYHTSALSSWRQDEFRGPGTWTQRSVCIDRLRYDKDGLPQTVQQTLNGPSPVTVTQPFASSLVAPGDGNELLSGGESLVCQSVDLGSGYYWASAKVSEVRLSSTASLAFRVGAADGRLIGSAPLLPELIQQRNGVVEASLRAACGIENIYLSLESANRGDSVRLESAKVIAGAPLPVGQPKAPGR